MEKAELATNNLVLTTFPNEPLHIISISQHAVFTVSILEKAYNKPTIPPDLFALFIHIEHQIYTQS